MLAQRVPRTVFYQGTDAPMLLETLGFRAIPTGRHVPAMPMAPMWEKATRPYELPRRRSLGAAFCLGSGEIRKRVPRGQNRVAGREVAVVSSTFS